MLLQMKSTHGVHSHTASTATELTICEVEHKINPHEEI